MIAILSASDNNNLQLAQKLSEIAQGLGETTEVIDLVDADLPLYTPKNEEKDGIPENAKKLAQILINSHAIIFVAPEYNGSFPPTFNNTIAWVSRIGDDWRLCFNGKPAAIATHSGGGGQYALLAMRSQLSYIGMNVIGRQILTNFNKPLNPDTAKDVIRQLIKYES